MMKFPSLLLAAMIAESHQASLDPKMMQTMMQHVTHRRTQKDRRQLKINDEGTCKFDDLVAGSETCTFNEWCIPVTPGTGTYCSGTRTGKWTLDLFSDEKCWTDVTDEDGFLPADDASEYSDGVYCVIDTITYSIDKGVVTKVDTNSTFTFPAEVAYLGKYTTEACDTDFDHTVGGKTYCEVGCPVITWDGTKCAGCVDCGEDGPDDVINCSNVFPSLIETCPVGDEFLSETVSYLYYDPTAAPVGGPTASPVAGPTDGVAPVEASPVEAPTSAAVPIAGMAAASVAILVGLV